MKAKICIIASILVIGSIFFGCATNRGITESGMSVTATGTSEGIRLEFKNIPKNTDALFVRLFDITSDGQQAGDPEAEKSTAIYIHGERLAELKQSGNLLCPFARNEHEYTVTIWDYNRNSEIKLTNIIAGGGIYLTNNPTLSFTDNNRTVTLSEMPTFSTEVTFSPKGLLEFSNFVIVDDNLYGGGMSGWEDLTYPVREVLSGTQEHFGFTGNFPVNASVRCLLVYDNYEWAVAVAKAEETAIMSF